MEDALIVLGSWNCMSTGEPVLNDLIKQVLQDVETYVNDTIILSASHR